MMMGESGFEKEERADRWAIQVLGWNINPFMSDIGQVQILWNQVFHHFNPADSEDTALY
jgi:hypothetical protein